MIRFYDKEVFCMEYDMLNRSELRSFFLKGNQKEIVCILKEGRYMGFITWPSLLGNDDLYESIQKEFIVLDEKVWENGRYYFARHETIFGEAVQLPVLDREGQLICFAWQDEEADRELRMLRELEECEGALTFCDLNPNYVGVTIHGCNEIAVYMAGYLTRLGISVNVEGELWKEFGAWENCAIMAHKNYEIWAEGVWQKSGDVNYERLRSVSGEFECVDEIYEANIKSGKITDAAGGVDSLLAKLRDEQEIIIIGTNTESQDAYDWLLENGIDVCAFLTENRGEEGRRLFGKPVLRKIDIFERFTKAVFIECHSRYSAWGFGEVDRYDCEGYRRNVQYFLLNDYVEIKGSNLLHVLQGKDVLLIGDINLCSRVLRWKQQCRMGAKRIRYWDILGENELEIVKLGIDGIKAAEAGEYNAVLLVMPEYDSIRDISEEATKKREEYIKRLKEYGIWDYTDYFSNVSRQIGLEIEEEGEVREELRPFGILIGAINNHSGNILFRQSLAGHPQILMIEEYCFLNENLYSICIRLAEKKASDILSGFWQLYQTEAKDGVWKRSFQSKEKFDQKMEQLLNLGDRFTSQELFVMFHIAYAAMYGREISDLKDIVIYWEPHMWIRSILRQWSHWLGSSNLKGYVLKMVRNGYVRAGSAVRDTIGEIPVWSIMMWMEIPERGDKGLYGGWEERVIRFEDLKKQARETMEDICQWMKIAFDEVLMKTTLHGETGFYKEITGRDLKPVYNLYEEYFTSFDRMRICLMQSLFQKKYGYPFVNPLDFRRVELQEMFLKEFLWEKIPEMVMGKDEEGMWKMQVAVRNRLWKMRFYWIMNIDEVF